MRPIWHTDDEKIGYHAALIADDRRVLIVSVAGELILLDAAADGSASAVVSRLRLFDDDVEIYSHPALVGSRLYLRGGDSIVCVDLGTAG
jgi:hypothetical protein